MKQIIKIGVACLARKTFDYEAAKEIYFKITILILIIEYVNCYNLFDLKSFF